MRLPATIPEEIQLVRSPLAQDHLDRGAALVPYHGAVVPRRFHETRAEYEAVRSAAGLFDFSFRSKFTLSGEHRVRFLHRIVSNDVKSLAVGQGVYATLLNAQGRILADLRIYAADDRLWVDSDADLAAKTTVILQRYIIGERVRVERDGLASVAFQGSSAQTVLENLLGEALGLDREMDHRVMTFRDQALRVVKLSSTGEEGYEVWLEPGEAVSLWRAALEMGAAKGLAPCGAEALEILRIEAGIPRYGPDLGEDTLPLEAGLLNALNFNKGCYIGQEIVERARNRGHVNWKLMGLKLEPDSAVPELGPLTADGKTVGEITSACFSPRLGRPIALAYLRREVAEPGLRFAVTSGSTAEVVELPFVADGRTR